MLRILEQYYFSITLEYSKTPTLISSSYISSITSETNINVKSKSLKFFINSHFYPLNIKNYAIHLKIKYTSIYTDSLDIPYH